jgi:hypothetical protein
MAHLILAALQLVSAGAFMPVIWNRRHIVHKAIEGNHGTGSRFMPLLQLVDEEIAPRIIQVAGIYPGVTVDEIMAPQSSPAAPLGMWQFDFSDPSGPQMGTVALSPNNAVQLCEDPVIVVSQSSVLGLSLSQNVDAEVLVLLDRAEREFVQDKFFAVAAPDGNIAIRWYDSLPAGHKVVAKVVMVTIPYLPAMNKKKSGFMEEDDGFSF